MCCVFKHFLINTDRCVAHLLSPLCLRFILIYSGLELTSDAWCPVAGSNHNSHNFFFFTSSFLADLFVMRRGEMNSEVWGSVSKVQHGLLSVSRIRFFFLCFLVWCLSATNNTCIQPLITENPFECNNIWNVCLAAQHTSLSLSISAYAGAFLLIMNLKETYRMQQ